MSEPTLLYLEEGASLEAEGDLGITLKPLTERRARGRAHQEEDLGVLLPQPEAGKDVVEPVHEEHHGGGVRAGTREGRTLE